MTLETAAKRTTRLQAIALGLIVLGGLWLRMADLGRPSFDTDEHYHLFAAQSLNEGRGLALPSGNEYTRARLYTHMVAAFFKWLGVSEAVARLPSVIFGVLLIALTYVVGRQWLGSASALVAAALVAASPLLVETSRLCRMYSVFQVFYLGAAFAYERGWERAGVRWRSRALWTLAGLGLLAVSLHVQTLTVVIAPAIAAYWLGRAVFRPRSRYTVFLAATVAVGAAVAFSGVMDVGGLWEKANRAPQWAQAHRIDPGFYMAEWGQWYPWLWGVLPVAALVALRRHRATSWFLLCQFAIPFALHSLVFDWKVRRYVSPLFVFVALLLAPVIVWGLGWMAAWLRESVRSGRRAWPKCAAAAAVGLALAVGGWPSLAQALRLRDDPRRPRWRQAYAFVREQMHPGDVVIAAVPLGAHHYLGHPATYALTHGEFDRAQTAPRNDEGLPLDWYTGVPMVFSVEELQRVQAAYPRGWIVSNRGRFTDASHTDPALQRYVAEHCRAYHPIEGSTTVFVFGWDRTGDTHP